MLRTISKVFIERMMCLVVSCVTRERLKMMQTNIQILLKIMGQQRNFLLQSIFSPGINLEIIHYQSYCQQQGVTLKIKGGKKGENSETYLVW